MNKKKCKYPKTMELKKYIDQREIDKMDEDDPEANVDFEI